MRQPHMLRFEPLAVFGSVLAVFDFTGYLATTARGRK